MHVPGGALNFPALCRLGLMKSRFPVSALYLIVRYWLDYQQLVSQVVSRHFVLGGLCTNQ